MTLRLVEQQRLALAKVRREAERKLEDATQKLDRPMFVGRGRRRELEAAIVLNRTAMRMTDEQLVQLQKQARSVREAPRPGRQVEMPPGRCAPALGHDPGLGL